MTESLAKLQLSPKKLGSILIRKATENLDGRLHDRVVSQIEKLLQEIAEGKHLIVTINKKLRLLEAQFEAIEKGRFTIDGYTGAIIFRDSSLGTIQEP